MPSLLESIFGGEQARKEWENQTNQGERYTQTPSLVETLTDEEKRKRWNAEYEAEKQRGANALPESTKKTITGYANEPTTPEQRAFSRRAAGMNLVETVDSTAGEYIPRIRVNDKGNGLVLSGTKTALESDLAKELREYLKDALQYQNLQSENTAKIIEELNNDVSEQVKRSIVENGVGMEYDKYKDYAHAMEVLSSTNPMNKTGAKNKIFGYDKDGNRVAKTPQEWIDYYRENYSSTDRAGLFSGSLMLMGQAGADSPMDPTLWTPYLVMSGGARSNTPLYGFDLGEQVLAGVEETVNQASARVLEGLSKGGTNVGFFLTNFSGYARRNVLNNVAQGLMGSDISAKDVPWISEKAFNDKLDSLADRSINSLGKEDKSLIIAALSAGTGLSASQLKTAIDSVETVGDLRDRLSYQTYIDNRDNIRTTEQYDEELDESKKQLEKGRNWLQNEVDAASIYAPVAVGAGHFIGTMMRYLAASSAISALTGGTIALNQIGDNTLGKVGELALRASQGKFGGNFVATGTAITKALSTPLGHFLGAVVTEIPEDIVQTAVDNVITDNADENWSLLTPESIAENTLQNLIMRGVWSMGANAVKTSAEWVKLKQIARANPLTRNIFIDGMIDDAEKVKNADAAGKITGVTPDGKIKIIGEDGVERVLDNTHILAFRDMEDSPILQELAHRFESSSPEITFEAIERAKQAVESGDYSGDVEVRIVQSPSVFDVDGHSYIGEGGYQKFISDNLSSNSGNSVKDKMLAIAVEQAIVTPGGDTDNINPLLRSGELVLGGDGEATSIEFKEKIDNIDIYALAANYYHNMDYFDEDGFGESGVEQNIVDLARELLGKKPLKNTYEFSREDIAAAEKVIRDALEDGVIGALRKGNYALKNDVILYRVVSEGGNNVNQGGDLSWLNKQSGEYSDKGFTSVTLNEDAVLNSPVLSGTGKKYILRYHIPSGENIYAFDGSVRTGDDTPLGDFRRASSGHRAGGEFMLTPDNNGIFVKSGEFKDGIEYVDVYIGKARDEYLDLIIPHKSPDSEFTVYRGQPYKRGESFTYNDPTLVGDNPRTVDEWTKHNSFGDAYFFTEKKDWAMEFGNSLVKWTLKESNTLSFDEFNILYEKAKELVADPAKMADYVAKNGEAAGEQMTRLAAYDFRAAAELSGKPVIMATEGKIGPEWLYFKGVDEEFDKHAYTQLLASTVPTSPEADAANVRMASSIQSAIDTSPYNKTPAEIVAKKYVNSGPISDAPNSASVKWETPQIEGSYQNIDYAMADQPTNLNMPEVKGWFDKAVNTANRYYQDNIVPKFAERYPTTTDQQLFVRNMHYLFDLQRMDGLTVEQAVGKTLVDIDGTRLEIRQEDIDFYNEVLAPYMSKLREYSAAGLKIDKPVDIVGYLPHTSYDPMDMTAEEALQQGVLHRKYSGASASTEDGNFTTTTLSDDLASEFNIFARNMIWDSLGEKAIVAKYMSEYHADGVDVSAEVVETSVKKQKALSEAMSKTKAAKDLDKELSGNKNIDWKQKNEVDIPEAAKKIGATRAVEQTYSPIYGKARDNGAYSQPHVIALQQTSDVMRKIVTPDGDMYSNGGRMVVAGAADAGYMAKRIFDQANDGHINATEIKQMFVDYLMQGGKRTQKGAEYIADQWMAKIAKDVGETGNITQRALTARLNSLIYFEGTSRLKRWVARADLDKFNTKTIDWMDEFFYRQGLLSREINASKTMANVNKAINKLISARMKSLFWLNVKNGILQSSECVRIFTEFKMGDALETIKRLASDADFRNEVDEWLNLLVPEQNFSKSAELADIYADIAKKSKIVDGDISVGKLTSAEEASLFEKIDKAAMTPIDMGENAKNRILIAGILQEAQGKGYTGDQLFNFVNKKFERIGLANNDMGRLAGADNPLFRIATNLKSFSIRQFGMYINNIQDMNGGEAVGYIIKNLGWKIGVATILAKLGYSVPQSLGLDPFDILDNDYTGVDEDNYNALDKVIAGPAGRALLSGGFTSYLADAYWAARQAYENKIATPAEEVDRKFEERGIFELAMPEVTFDNMLNFGGGFVPGYTQGKRVLDMADLQNSGWAVSATGNIMYAAADNPFDAATGYVFGRSNTPNARTYYQTADPLQGLIEGGIPGLNQQFFGRGFNLGGGFRNFDPIDSRNYSDWFYGDTRDDQQWNVGYYYFREQAQKLQDEYQNALRNSYDEDSRNAVYNSYNSRLRELDDSIARFVQAYQAKNPGKFDANKMNNVLTVMRTYQPDLNADELQRDEQFFNANDNALQRYVAAGLPQTVSYKYVEDKEHPEKSGTQVEYSPQVRAAMQGRYGLPEEASRLVKQTYNDKWKDLNKEYRDKYYGAKGSRAKKAIQAEYFNLVRKDLDPIVALYGAEIFSNDDVDDVMEDVFNSMTPYGTSVKKYLQGKYKNYMAGSISYSQPGNETITEIRGLLDQGKTARGKALARTLLQRVQENRQALTRDELEWLQGVLND